MPVIIFLIFVNSTAYTQSGKPDILESIQLFSSTSLLNQQIEDDAALDPNSQQYIDTLGQAVENITIQVKQFSSPVYFADSSTPRHDVSLGCGLVWELGVDVMRDVPIPEFAEPANDVDGADNPVPAEGCGEDAGQDNNMVVIDLDSRCEYDFWQTRKVNGEWITSWANGISIDGDGVHAQGLSTRGSGFAFLAGVIWPHELEQDAIRHALLFNLPDEMVRGGGPVPPATETDGESNSENALPEGSRLRLDPELDLDSIEGLTTAERTIAVAMQEYGMFLTDRGGGPLIGLYAIDPLSVNGNPYEGLLPDGDFVVLDNIPLDRLQVMELPARDTDYQQNLGLPETSCRTYGLQGDDTQGNGAQDSLIKKLLPILFSED